MSRHLLATATFVLAAFVNAATVAPLPAQTLEQQLGSEDAPLVLDVRTEAEYRDGHVPGAVHIPYDELPRRLAEIGNDTSQPIVVYCRTGRRAAVAQKTLVQAGFSDTRVLHGHWRSWPGAKVTGH